MKGPINPPSYRPFYTPFARYPHGNWLFFCLSIMPHNA